MLLLVPFAINECILSKSEADDLDIRVERTQEEGDKVLFDFVARVQNMYTEDQLILEIKKFKNEDNDILPLAAANTMLSLVKTF